MAGMCMVSGGAPTAAKVLSLTLPAASWQGAAAPFTLTIAASGVYKSGYLFLAVPTPDSYTAYGNAAIAMQNITTDGSVTFYAQKKPTANLNIYIARWLLAD